MLKSTLVTVLLLLSRLLVWAQPTVVTTCSTFGNNVTTLTVSGCTATGSTRWVGIGVTLAPKTDDVSFIDYGGATPTLVSGAAIEHSIEDIELRLYGLKMPATGAQNLQVDSTGFTDMTISALLLDGVDQTTPLGTAQTASSTGSATYSVAVTSAATDRVIGWGVCFFGDGFAFTEGAGQTEHLDLDTPGIGQAVEITSEVAVNATISGTYAQALDGCLAVAVPVHPVVVAAVGFQGRRRQ